MESNLKGMAAIVTGGASGIGLATSKALSESGVRVVIADLNEQKSSDAARSITASTGVEALGIPCDVSKPEDVRKSVDAALAHFKQLHIIVNNAGLMTFRAIEDLGEDDWLKVLRVDLLGTFYFIKEGFRVMQPGSAIVNVSSIHAVETTPNVAPYAAAKAAVVSLTHSAALEGRPKGIRVNAVLPGAIDTPMLRENPNIKAGLETIGKGDVGSPEDIAHAIEYLVSPSANFIQGATLRVDGGRLARL